MVVLTIVVSRLWADPMNYVSFVCWVLHPAHLHAHGSLILLYHWFVVLMSCPTGRRIDHGSQANIGLWSWCIVHRDDGQTTVRRPVLVCGPCVLSDGTTDRPRFTGQVYIVFYVTRGTSALTGGIVGMGRPRT